MNHYFKKSILLKIRRIKVFKYVVVLVVLGLFFNECMTMGWGGDIHSGLNESTQSTASLVKEIEYHGIVFRAEFPEATVNQNVKFVLNIISGKESKDLEKYDVSMVIRRQVDLSSGSSYIRTGTDSKVTGGGHWIFTHRFSKVGYYTVSFEVTDSARNEPEAVTTLSAERYVAASTTSPHHKNSFYRSFWFIGGTVVMLGMMVWMLSM